MLRTELDGPRITFTIDDPERRNPLTNEVVSAMIAELRALPAQARVVVLTGAGDRAFCAGGDLAGGFFEAPVETHSERAQLAELFRLMRRCGRPVIARVNGHALAGGFGLMLGCDTAISVDSATFGMPEVGIGLWPMVITAVAQRALAPKVALDLMMTGRRFGADEALALGAVSQVVPVAQLDTAIDAAVDALVEKSAAVVALGKDAFYAAQDMPFDAALDFLASGITAVALTDDAREGLAAFVGKRTPRFEGR